MIKAMDIKADLIPYRGVAPLSMTSWQDTLNLALRTQLALSLSSRAEP